MSYTSLLIHTVTLNKRVVGATDRYGNETITYSNSGTSAARLEQTDSKEVLGDRDTRLTWFRVFLPAGTNVSALDRLIWGTRTLEVDGEPVTYYDRTMAHHMTAMAREISD